MSSDSVASLLGEVTRWVSPERDEIVGGTVLPVFGSDVSPPQIFRPSRP